MRAIEQKGGRRTRKSRDVSGTYLSKQETAAMLGVCVETVTGLMKKGVLPYYKLTNKLVLIKRSELERMLKEHRRN